MVAYFLWLGALGFGGPVALANYMRRDLVERRGWLTEDEYDDGLALSASCPGPLAYQLGVYCGYIRFGLRGGLAVAVAFALPPFILVTILAHVYHNYLGPWEVRAVFYGVAPVVVALILRACWNLGKKTLGKDAVAWLLFAVGFGVTAVTQQELTALFIGGGIFGIFWFGRRGAQGQGSGTGGEEEPSSRSPADSHGSGNQRSSRAFLPLLASWFSASGISVELFWFFLKTGFLVFGSGLVIVPFLKSYVVDQYQWLGDQAFLDAVAIGMVSPGPVVITATFVGYSLDGLVGALAATVGIFTPAVLFTSVATPLLRKYRSNPRLQGFVRGVTVMVVGVLVGTTVLVAQEAIGDWVTAGIGLVSLAVLFIWDRFPHPLLVLIAGAMGFGIFYILQPQWVFS